MQITVFGVLWVLLVIGCFFLNNMKPMIYVTLFSMILQCNNVFSIAGVGIGVQIFTVSIALVRILLLSSSKVHISKFKHITRCVLALLMAVLISLLANDLFNDEYITAVAMLAIYILFFCLLTKKNIYLTSQELIKIENVIIVAVLTVGLLQMLCKAGILPIDAALKMFVYNDITNTDVIFNYKPLNVFYSTFMEPSFCGAFLVGSFALVCSRAETNLKNVVLAILLGVAILLTKSSTAYGGLAIIICLMMFLKTQKRIFKLLIPVALLGGIIMVIYFSDVLNEVIFDKANTSSFAVRSNWNKAALEAFYSKPVVGIGYRNIRASSLFYSILGEIGILGMLSYLAMLLTFLKMIFNRHDKAPKGAIMMVLGVVVCQFIACPDLNFSPFWLSIYCFALEFKGGFLRGNGYENRYSNIPSSP